MAKLASLNVRECNDKNIDVFINGNLINAIEIELDNNDDLVLQCREGFAFAEPAKLNAWSEGIYPSNVLELFYYGMYSEPIEFMGDPDDQTRAVAYELNKVKNVSSLEWTALEVISTGEPVEPEPVILVRSFPVTYANNNHVDVLINGEVINSDDNTIYEGDVLSLKTRQGYQFLNEVDGAFQPVLFKDSVLALDYSGAYGGTVRFIASGYDDGDFTTALAEDFQDLSRIGAFSWYVMEVIPTDDDDVAGLNNVYLLDKDKLREVTRARFETGDPSDPSSLTDYGQYIINLMQLPFSIGEVETTTENVFLATHNTEVLAPSLGSDKIVLNLGDIVTPVKYGDFRDYLDTTCKLFLPYAEAIDIDSKYVIGEVINVEYIINCYDGVATINITSSKVDGIVTTKSSNLGFNIPLANIYNEPKNLGSNSVDFGGLNHIIKPYIEVVRSNVVNFDGSFNIPVIDSGMLSDVSGYVEVSNVRISGGKGVTEYERSLLENILRNGVFFND